MRRSPRNCAAWAGAWSGCGSIRCVVRRRGPRRVSPGSSAGRAVPLRGDRALGVAAARCSRAERARPRRLARPRIMLFLQERSRLVTTDEGVPRRHLPRAAPLQNPVSPERAMIQPRPVTIKTLRRMKERGEPACLTCYDATTRWLERPACTLPVATPPEVVLGFDSTVHMPLDVLLALTGGGEGALQHDGHGRHALPDLPRRRGVRGPQRGAFPHRGQRRRREDRGGRVFAHRSSGR